MQNSFSATICDDTLNKQKKISRVKRFFSTFSTELFPTSGFEYQQKIIGIPNYKFYLLYFFFTLFLFFLPLLLYTSLYITPLLFFLKCQS